MPSASRLPRYSSCALPGSGFRMTWNCVWRCTRLGLSPYLAVGRHRHTHGTVKSFLCGIHHGGWSQLHQGACGYVRWALSGTIGLSSAQKDIAPAAGAAVAGQDGCLASPAVIWADAGLSVAHVPGLRAQHPAQTQHQTHTHNHWQEWSYMYPSCWQMMIAATHVG